VPFVNWIIPTCFTIVTGWFICWLVGEARNCFAPGMSDTEQHDKGSFCWFEVVTSDPEATSPFFQKVLGWELAAAPMPEGLPPYNLIQLGGKDIGGMFKLTEEMKQQGAPPHVLGYIAVEDLDAVLPKVKELGGSIIMEKTAVMDKGHMAIIATPEGAVNCFWQSASHTGSQVTGEVGTPCWFELNSRDATGVAKFFSELLDLEVRTMPFPDPNCEGDYTLLGRGGKDFFGILQMGEEWGEMPSHWMTYFQVDNIQAVCETIKGAGGEVCYDPFELTDIGQIAICSDPAGIHFTVMEPAGG